MATKQKLTEEQIYQMLDQGLSEEDILKIQNGEELSDDTKTEEAPNINPTGQTQEVTPDESYGIRAKNAALGAPEIDKYAANVALNTPFGLRLASMANGIPVEQMREGLEQYNAPQVGGERLSETIAGVAGQMTPSLPLSMGMGMGATGAVSKIAGASPRLAQFAGNVLGQGAFGGLSAASQGGGAGDIAKGAGMGALFGAAGSAAGIAGANLVPRGIKFAERAGNVVAGAGVTALQNAMNPNLSGQEKLANYVANAVMDAKFYQSRQADITALQRKQEQLMSAKKTITDLGILRSKKGEGAKQFRERADNMSEALVTVFKNSLDQDGNVVVPKTTTEMIDVINKAESSEWKNLVDIEKTAERGMQNVGGKNRKRVRFVVDQLDISKEIKNLLGDRLVRMELEQDPAAYKRITKLMDIIKSKHPTMDSLDVDNWLRIANAKRKSLYSLPAQDRMMASSEVLAQDVVARAVSRAHENMLNSVEATAGKAWKEQRKKIGGLLELKSKLPRDKYDVDYTLGESVVQKGSRIWNAGQIAKNMITGHPIGAAKSLAKLVFYKDKRFSGAIADMYKKMEAAENKRTLNQRISDVVTEERINKVMSKIPRPSLGMSVEDVSGTDFGTRNPSLPTPAKGQTGKADTWLNYVKAKTIPSSGAKKVISEDIARFEKKVGLPIEQWTDQDYKSFESFSSSKTPQPTEGKVYYHQSSGEPIVKDGYVYISESPMGMYGSTQHKYKFSGEDISKYEDMPIEWNGGSIKSYRVPIDKLSKISQPTEGKVSGGIREEINKIRKRPEDASGFSADGISTQDAVRLAVKEKGKDFVQERADTWLKERNLGREYEYMAIEAASREILSEANYADWLSKNAPQPTEGKPQDFKTAEEYVASKGTTIYHGSGTKFDAFDDSMRGTITGAKSAKGAIWFTDNPKVAKAYSVYAAETGPVKALLDKADAAEKIAQKTGKQSDWDKQDEFLRQAEELDTYEKANARRELADVKEAVISNNLDMLEIDAKGKTPQELSTEGDIDSWLNEQIKKAKKQNKDGLIIKNLDDAVGLYNVPSTHYAIFDSSKIKLKSQLISEWEAAQKSQPTEGKVAEIQSWLSKDILEKQKKTLSGEKYMKPVDIGIKELHPETVKLISRPDVQSKINRATTELKDSQYTRVLKREIIAYNDLFNAMDGKKTTFMQPALYKHLKGKGIDGLWAYNEKTGFLSGSSKPEIALPTGLINCNPTKGCAYGCYAAEGNSAMVNSIFRDTMNDILINKDPMRVANNVVKQWNKYQVRRVNAGKPASEYLRFMDRGEANQNVRQVLDEVNRQGVKAHVFTKIPELYRGADPKNIINVSIDRFNFDSLKDNIPEGLQVAVNWAGPSDNHIVNYFVKNKKIGVVLPWEGESTPVEIKKFLQTLPRDMDGYICPVNSKRVELKNWNCFSCGKCGDGCAFRNNPISSAKLNKLSVSLNQLGSFVVLMLPFGFNKKELE